MSKKRSFFSKNLITWYLQNKRDLPWRNTSDPYRIWLSEIMLQQTRVAQGLPYYLTFVTSFPTVEDLAKASEEKVLKLWQGLGYYSRARNLHFTAKYVANELDGSFPNSYKELLRLKGVGDYTASAIASICYAEPAAVVDGNVYRVLSRVFGVETPINSTAGIKEFKELAQALIDHSQPGVFNQAIMEFGARYCVPQNPNCSACIFNDNCVALQRQKVGSLPVKPKKQKVRIRYFNYLVFVSEDNSTILKQRLEKGIWQHLYEFPLIETERLATLKDLQTEEIFQYVFKDHLIEDVILYNELPIIHKLSHQHLHTRFWIVETAALTAEAIPIKKLEDYAVPVLIQNFISEFSRFKN